MEKTETHSAKDQYQRIEFYDTTVTARHSNTTVLEFKESDKCGKPSDTDIGKNFGFSEVLFSEFYF